MSKRAFAFVSIMCLVAFLWAATAFAAGQQYLEFGIGYNKYDYDENLDAGLKSTESGWVPGVSFSWGYMGEDNPTYAKITFRYRSGETDYDGTLQDGTPAKGKTDNSYYDFEIKAGYIFGQESASRWRIIPYSGIGYHDWERGLGGPNPYVEEYTWFYLPLGVIFDYRASEEFTIGLDISARVMFNGQMNVKFSQLGLSSPNLDLGNRIGFRAELPMDYRFHPQVSMGVTPWYQYTSIGSSQSEPVTAVSPSETTYTVMTIKEPSSTTHQYGADITLRFWF